jgi:hypothetical protein
MNIYLVSQDENNGYDTYDSFVCYAESEEDARVMSPSPHYIWKNSSWNFLYSDGSYEQCNSSAWCHPNLVEVELIGITSEDVESGVVLASFNAG